MDEKRYKKRTHVFGKEKRKKAEVKHFSQTNIAMWIFIFLKYNGFYGKKQQKMGKIENCNKIQTKKTNK